MLPSKPVKSNAEKLLIKIKWFRETGYKIRGIDYTYNSKQKLDLLECLAMCSCGGFELATVNDLSQMSQVSLISTRKLTKGFYEDGICDRKRDGHKFVYWLNEDYLKRVINV